MEWHHRDPGESPPPAPRNFVGRTELLNHVVLLAEAGTPVALIGTGGMGKTSIGLALLDDERIKERFGANRRFLRCEELESYSHFLSRLSSITGAGAKNPPDITTLRPFLSAVHILIILDNAETILDPHTSEAQIFYSAIEELSRIRTISLVITTRISTIPPTCQQLEVPTLSIASAREAFFKIYKQDYVQEIDFVLEQLDFHPLSITLIAVVATQNRWNQTRLLQEWKTHRVSLLQTWHNPGLSTAIEPSLSSPMFTSLGPNARDILVTIAFLPQGVNETELEWVFPTQSNIKEIVDTFSVLSLTHRNHGFVTMLAPAREYLLTGMNPTTLFPSVIDQYLTRLCNIAHNTGHDQALQQDTRWLISEQANIDAILALSSKMYPESTEVSRACRAVKLIASLKIHSPA